MKRKLVPTLAMLGATAVMTFGCATPRHNLPEVMRNNAVVMQYGTTQRDINYFSIDQEKYQKAVNLFQAIGESGAVKGLTFPSSYTLMGTEEKTKEKIAKEVMLSYSPGQLANIVARYGETKAAEEMKWWKTNAIIKDVTSAVFWSSVASCALSTGGGGSDPTPVSGTVGKGGRVGHSGAVTITP